MSKYLLDTNLLIDIMSQQRPRHFKVMGIISELAAISDNELSVLSSSLKDAYYTSNKHYHNEETSRVLIQKMVKAFKCISLTQEVISVSLVSDEPDFEDGLIRAAAELSGCDYILTADKEAFLNSSVQKVLIE